MPHALCPNCHCAGFSTVQVVADVTLSEAQNSEDIQL